MKLTQKTLFQCFDKSERQSTVNSNDSDEDIIECEPEIKLSDKRSNNHVPRSDFLIPVHVRQEDNLSKDECVSSLLNSWKLIDSNDDLLSKHSQDFYRMCPTSSNSNETNSPKLQFIQISSIERQMELLEEYIKDDESSCYVQSNINSRVMFQCLQEYRKKAIEQNQYEQLPWTEIYRPRNSKAYLGNHTKQIRRLNEWFFHWANKLRNHPSKKITRKGRKRTRDYDDNSDEDFINESNMIYHDRCQIKQEYPQIIFIHGCGTTSLVHALAEQHNFKVTEINGTQSRARTSLIKQLEQVTSQHCLSLKRCSSDTIIPKEDKFRASIPLPVKKKAKHERGTIMSFFNTKKAENNDDHKENKSRNRSKSTKKSKQSKIKEDEQKSMPTNLVSSVQVEKTSLILFDEIETLTTDDNFWSCLKKILETAKKPIILTSNSRSNPDDAIFNLSKIGDYEMVHLETNELKLTYCFLRLILLVEMLEVPSFDELISLCQSCSYDLRRCLLTLQFLAQSSTIENTSIEKTAINNTKPKLQSSHVFDTMHYSYLGEQWNEPMLKTYFDDLTTKYTSEYEQYHKLLANQNKNDSKRIELYDTFRLFMQEQELDNITDRSALYLDYRPYIRQICQSEQIRASESYSRGRLRHGLGFRGCSLQWSDFAILSGGLD
ncbi:unnamed protein product [Rotaria socialis]|uniref:ATPase AAA-type core domain-containing protein n=1 Tax=Rotaria socialis TaxID=392032 RepID=A0A818A3C8_9BILA|nr:unnamed protein product [Rotaria socialis]CAF4265519.1 unnamed protein product [Rotaria socialis]